MSGAQEIAERRSKLSAAKRNLLKDRLRKALAGDLETRIPRRSRQAPLPLSQAQERLWFLEQLEPRRSLYSISRALSLRGRLEPRLLRRALHRIVERHEALRTTFVEQGGKPVQQISPAADLDFATVDLRQIAAERRSRQARHRIRSEGCAAFDLTRGPLLRARLLRLADEEWILVLTLHHLVFDGWSFEILLRELSQLYRALAEGSEPKLAELPIQYGDYAVWEQERASGDAMTADLDYWRERLGDDLPSLDLPVDRPRPSAHSYDGALRGFRLPPDLATSANALAQAEETSLFTVLLAGWALLLSRSSGQTDFAVGSPFAGRSRAETEGLIGFFVNTLPLRCELSGHLTARALLSRLRHGVIEALDHQGLPFARLLEELAPDRSLSHAPFFQVLFALQSTPAGDVDLPAAELTRLETVDRGTTDQDLTLLIEENGAHLDGMLIYSTDLFEATTIERWLRQFRQLLRGVTEDPARRISELPWLDGAERHQLLEEWADTTSGYPRDATIPELFEAQAATNPDAVAVVCGQRAFTYRALNRQAERLASHLRALGVGPEVPVGLCFERSPEMVVAVLGILKAGGAYLPLDPEYPAERLGFMLEDTRAAVVVTHDRLASLLPAHTAALLCLEHVLVEDDAKTQPRAESAAALAYVMYTSGSTGRPKGVAVPHRAVVRLVRESDYARLGPDEVFLQFAPISFDAATLEIWGPLLNGGRLAMLEHGTPSLEELSRELEHQRVSSLWLTAGLFHQVVDGQLESLRGVRQLLAGGDVLSTTHVAKVLAELPDCRLINGYGPTENTTFTCCHSVTGLREGSTVPIGRPIADTRIYVTDRRLRPQALAVAGELTTGGDGLSRGYFGRPARTAHSFVPDPFNHVPGERLYRTGDLARWLPESRVEFFGRLDHQVKLRGFRIEPGEIESVLGRHPDIAETVAVIRDDEAGGRRLVAYAVADAGDAPAAGELRGYLSESLPDYMVPGAFVFLDALPLNPNGKVDRKALPEPVAVAPATGEDAPRTPVEDLVAGIWCRVLGIGRVGIHDSFFDLGGHSLNATRVLSRLREAFAVELPLRALFEAPTVAELAARVATARHAAGRSDAVVDAPPVEPVPRTVPPALSFGQRRHWLIERLEPGSTAYHVPFLLRLSGPLDAGALAHGLEEIERRHEVLRTTFELAGEEPIQVIQPTGARRLSVVDLSRAADPAAIAERLATTAARRLFNLERGPLLRSMLLRLSTEEHLLAVVVHHIVFDGWSMRIFFEELAALYGAFAAGDENPLPELPVQYADFADWQHQRMDSGSFENQLTFWTRRLAQVPPLELPTDRPRPTIRTARGSMHRFAWPRERAVALETFAHRQGASLFMVLMAAFQSLLGRTSGQDDVAVGIPVANRSRPELEGLIGFFVNTLVVRGDLSAEPSFAELLSRVREEVLALHDHRDLPFEKLVETLEPERSLSRAPLFQVAFTYQNEPFLCSFPGLDADFRGLDVEDLVFDLTLGIVRTGSGLSCLIQFSAELFDATTIHRLIARFDQMLTGAMTDPARRISELPWLDGAERHQLLEEWADTTSGYPRDATIPELFEAQAATNPDAVAVVCGQRAFTYRALNRQAERLASHLRALGVGPEVPVGLCFERSPEMVVAVLGILKAGGAYLPLDPEYPAERLGFMLEDTRAAVVVTHDRLASLLPAHTAALLCLEHVLVEDDAKTQPRAESAAALAYVMYTSGSTGRPKGVAVPHRAVVRLVRESDYARLGPDEVFLQFAPISFDAATLEIWGPLLNGGRLAMLEHGTPSLEELSRELEHQRVSSLWLTAGLFHQVVDGQLESLRGVRQLLAGGDVLSTTHVAKVLAELPDCRLINGYGPTENTTFTCCHSVTGLREGSTVPIGRPIADTRIYVTDRRLRPQALAVAGELTTGGDGLSRGYFGRPARTAHSFVPDPFNHVPGERLYRTGDLARWLPESRVEFFGRLDHQVKLRGFRIEPGEIESVLGRHPDIAETVAVIRDDEAGGRRLVAYAVADAGDAPAAGELRGYLSESLPDYMVPGAFVFVDALPLTPNGKVDRKALPEPVAEPEPVVAVPRTPVEDLLAGIWCQVMELEQVGIHDNFFELGGHSLYAMQMLGRVHETFSAELPMLAVFEAPTVAELAARVEAARRDETAVEAPPVVPASRDAPLPLSFAQQRQWFIDRLEPGSPAYNIPLVLRLTGSLDVAALEGSLREIERRHEALRTTIGTAAGEPIQIVGADRRRVLPVVDLSALAGGRAAARHQATEQTRRPFDLERGPLWRTVLLRLKQGEHLFVAVIHHIVFDGWSSRLFMKELARLYETLAAGGRQSPLPELPLQVGDFAHWQRRYVASAALRPQLAYWKEHLERVRPLALPADRPRLPMQTYRGAALTFAVGRRLAAELETLGRERGASLFMVLMAAFQSLLSRASHQDDLTVGIPVATRPRADFEGLIGFLINTLVLRGDLSGAPSFSDLLHRVREDTLAAYAHQDVPFEMLIQELQPERDLSRTPLFQVMFTFQNEPLPQRIPGLEVEFYSVRTGSAAFELTLGVVRSEAGLQCLFEYSEDLFDETSVRRLAGHFQTLLEGLAADPDRRVDELPLSSPAQRHQLLWEWGDTPRAPDAPASLVRCFEARVEQGPEAVALTFADRQLSYGELNRRANQLAHFLGYLGVEPGVGVGLWMRRSPDLVVSLLAILKAGGAYVPIDPDAPRERLAFLLEDSDVAVLLTHLRGIERLPMSLARVVAIDAESEDIASCEDDNSVAEPGGGELAYVIYTSGSTGKPKGVGVSRRALAAHCLEMGRHLGLSAEDRVLQFASLSFDVSLEQLLPPLISGSRVVLRDQPWSPRDLRRNVDRLGLTVMDLTPGYWRDWVAETVTHAAATPATTLRLVSVGGEAMPVEPALRWRRSAMASARLLNAYGPTEATITATAFELPGAPAETFRAGVPIGRPVTGRPVRLLDRRGELVPAGVPGELCLGGSLLARGYLGRPARTARSFLPDRFSDLPGSRSYATADLARHHPDGLIEFLGRRDHQVKVRGFRVELGEVERALRAHPAIREASVAAHPGPAEDLRLIAYPVAEGDAQTPTGELRELLRQKLPGYMIPEAFVWMPELPRLVSGKVDREALPAPDRPEEPPAPAELPEPSLRDPSADVEATLIAIWGQVLEIDRVGLDDSFFDLGGHSLLLMRVQSRLEEELGRQLPMVDLFRYPTVRSLAEYLRAGSEKTAPALAGERAAPAESSAIAIVGISCRFPGANDVEQFWNNLRQGVESITFYSREELAEAGVEPQLLDHPDYVRARGNVEDIDLFDAAFFGFTPREAELMDPQQRFFLECSWQALENAGCDPESYDGSIGVFAGVGPNIYLFTNLAASSQLTSAGLFQTLISNDKDSLTTHVSYKLNLTGPSVAVQTTCSTSLVAVHLAARTLLDGECDMAMAGGVTLGMPAKAGYLYEEDGIKAPDGHCRAFDAAARGTVPGSGAGIVVLKRLADAVADGDSIAAVIRGSALNNDGAAKVGYTAPSVEGQARVIAAAQAAAGVDPATITYVETHGTGTVLGDPIEVAALREAFGTADGRKDFCALGSVKSNVGHLDTAAGVAGLIKTVLALQHRELPPSLHFERPNPELQLEGSPFYVNSRLTPWTAAGPLRAGVSSFGIGGTNAHAVLEEAPAAEPSGEARPWQLVLLSARSDAALESATDRLAAHLGVGEPHDLADVAFTLQVGRRAFGHRRIAVCRDTAGAAKVLDHRNRKRVVSGAAMEGGVPRPVFLFPGQGAQYVGMGAELYRQEPVFRRQVDTCCELLADPLKLDLRQVLFPKESARDEAAERLRQTAVTQPALFVIEYACARLWQHWGVRPEAMIGHSIGEYVAACLADVFSFEDALTLVATRGRLMQSVPAGAMLAVHLPESELRSRLGDELEVAARNSPDSAVLSGTSRAVAEVEARWQRDGVECRRLHVSHAFHSGMMEPILEPFRQQVAKVELRPPRIPILSNSSGTWLSDRQAVDPGYWSEQLRRPVLFAAGVSELLSDPRRVFLEVGPGRGLSTLVRHHPDAEGRQVVSSMRHPRDKRSDTEVLLEALGRLWLTGVTPDWQGFHGDNRRRRLPLPTYPFERRRFWIEPHGQGDAGNILAMHSGEAAVTDRQAGPGHARPELPADYVAPRNEAEEKIAAIWQGQLGIEPVGVDDDFIELGGDSLLATQVMARVRDELAVELGVADLFEAETIAGLAEVCARAREGVAEDHREVAEAVRMLEGLSDDEVEAMLAADATPEPAGTET